MDCIAIALFFIYPIVGFSTMYILQKYKMRTAYILYLVMFLIVFMYLPFYAAKGLLGDISEQGSLMGAVEIFECFGWDPFTGTECYINYAYIAVIGISAFLCLSVLFFAMAAFDVVRKIRAHLDFKRFSELEKQKNINKQLARRCFMHTKGKLFRSLCRYNC